MSGNTPDRRTVLAALGSTASVGAVGCVSSVVDDSNDDAASLEDTVPTGAWTQVGYDARNTSHARGVRGPRNDATVAWDALGDRPVYPPVVDDALYFTEAWTEGAALSLASDDGASRWSNADLPPMRWAPALHDDTLFAVTRAEGNVVRLHALDTATGDQVWVREEGITASGETTISPGPTVRDDSIYLPSARGMTACDATDGGIKWDAELNGDWVGMDGGGTRDTIWATPAVTPERVFTFDGNVREGETRTVHALDRATGDPDWTADLELTDGWSLMYRPVAGRDHVFVSTLRPDSWRSYADDEWEGRERLFALDAASGAVDWEWELPRTTLSPPAFADGTLYVGEWYPDADTGRVHAVDPVDGRVTWTYVTETGAVRHPTVAGDTVYAWQGEELAAVATDDGSQRWRLPIGDSVAGITRFGQPVVVDGAVYLTANAGRNSDSRLLAVREP